MNTMDEHSDKFKRNMNNGCMEFTYNNPLLHGNIMRVLRRLAWEGKIHSISVRAKCGHGIQFFAMHPFTCTELISSSIAASLDICTMCELTNHITKAYDRILPGLNLN